ncbi:MAG: hypothetical protein EXS55_02685 [Candidatus Magasanikbacteria bacterium]|nr:hypothetical protein [Candidatus Magasanikbacteria bacterium]
MGIDQATNRDLNPDQQIKFDKDQRDLKNFSRPKPVGSEAINLDYCLKSGLDPLGMLAVRDTLQAAYNVMVDEEGTNNDEVQSAAMDIFKNGPWKYYVSGLQSAESPTIRALIVLAAAQAAPRNADMTPPEYLKDRERVTDELQAYQADQFENRKKQLAERAKNSIEKVGENGLVPVVSGEMDIALAMLGYRGCVSKINEMYVAKAADIGDQSLEEAGLVRGYIDLLNPKTQVVERIPYSYLLRDEHGRPVEKGEVVWVQASDQGKDIAAMEPVAKRIGDGKVVTYKNETLAITLVAKASKDWERKLADPNGLQWGEENGKEAGGEE